MKIHFCFSLIQIEVGDANRVREIHHENQSENKSENTKSLIQTTVVRLKNEDEQEEKRRKSENETGNHSFSPEIIIQQKLIFVYGNCSAIRGFGGHW